MTMLEQKIEKAQANLDAVNEKIANLKQKAKSYEAELALLKKTQEREKMEQLSEMLNAKGVDIDTLMQAVRSGDFSVLKENENSFAMKESESSNA